MPAVICAGSNMSVAYVNEIDTVIRHDIRTRNEGKRRKHKRLKFIAIPLSYGQESSSHSSS